MEFFTPGNLLTLGIVLFILILYRQLDRNSRTLKLLRDYSEKLKKELKSFTEEQEKAVKDYAVSLNVEKDSAKELMKRLQLTEEEMAEKAAAVSRIDAQLKGYENSLSELDKMTARVQENMSRVRDESAFVESANKRISEAKNKLHELDNELRNLEARFERENSESLEKTAEAVLASVRSTVSDLRSEAETAERRVEDHRQEINKIEQDRAASLARDTETINKMLSRVLEQAAKRADKMEDAALASLKEQAEDRIRKLKNSEEERLRSYHESAKERVAEVNLLVKNIREEWRAERSEWEARDKALREERKKDIHELNSQFADSEKHFTETRAAMEKQFADTQTILEKRLQELSGAADKIISAQEAHIVETIEAMKQNAQELAEGIKQKTLETIGKDIHELDTRLGSAKHQFTETQALLDKRLNELSARTNEVISSQEALLKKSAEDMKQKALEFTGAKLEEYRLAQDAEFRRLQALADDSKNLDAELRRSMDEMINRLREDFSRYEKDSAELRKAETDKFAAAAVTFGKELAEMEKELAALKSVARESVSEKLKIFEDDFVADLSSRHNAIDKRLFEWQENLNRQLNQIDENAKIERQELERSLVEEMRNKLSTIDVRLVTDLERLKTETSVFEEGIRERINAADDSVLSFKEQLDRTLEGARKEAEISIKSEIGKHSLVTMESVKQYQRELDEAREGFIARIRELETTAEDSRRRLKEFSAETDARIASVRSSVEDAERHIQEAIDQTKLVDKAEMIRVEMERRIEDLKGDMERLEQRRIEVAQLENDFIKIKRLEDDVNAKMTRFLSEKRRIETMETDFNRLLTISRSVDEKLSEVTSSDDLLQGLQLQIRKLEEALGTAEEKFQRIERKNQILENTNDGIDRNFRALQDSEKVSAKIGGELDRYAEDLTFVKNSIEKLAAESEKAREALDRIDVLDNALEEIEERISSMQRARQWIADAETRLEELNKQAQTQARAIDAVVKGKKTSPIVDLGEGAPPPQKKENVVTLARQGWKVDEIARAMKISRGEVELILEMAPKDM